MSLSLGGNSAATPAETMVNREKTTTFPEKVWGMLACFRSVQLAIILLSLLALATMAGVLLPQEGLVDVAQIKHDFGPNYRILKAMGFFNVYSSYWFLTLEVLFFFNLLFGSFKWLKPAYLAATQKTFCTAQQIQKAADRLQIESTLPMVTAQEFVLSAFKKARYQVHAAGQAQPDQQMFYASKGNWTRLGPAVAHAGILLCLIASVYGVFTGFKAQKLAVPGETFRIQDAPVFMPNIQQNLWLGSVPDWKIRVNDFRIEYYGEDETPTPGIMAKQYYADLSVIDKNNRETRREVISVNHPLVVGDTVLYQASFNPTGKLFVEVDGKPLKIETNGQFMNRPVSFTDLGNGKTLMVFPFFIQQDPNVTRNYAVFFLRDAKGFVGAKPGQMPPNLRLLEGQSGSLQGVTLKYVKPEIATGLQIKKGPEVPLMYFSYLIITLGAFMCIFSQRRIWIAVTPSAAQGATVHLLYKTNKARLSFLKELQKLQTELNSQLNPSTVLKAEPQA
jgi:cytochrome c biogenesis protein